MRGARWNGLERDWRSVQMRRWRALTPSPASTPRLPGGGARAGTQSWRSVAAPRCRRTRQARLTPWVWRKTQGRSGPGCCAISRSSTTGGSWRRWSGAGSAGSGEILAQFLGGRVKVLVDHLDFAQHGHEVCVPVPARNHVKVDVIGDAGPGRAAHVDADVEPLRLEREPKDRNRASERTHEIGSLIVAEVADLILVDGGSHHRVAGVVGELIQEYQRALRPPKHEIGVGVGRVFEDPAEEAAGSRLAGHVLHAPGRPQTLH